MSACVFPGSLKNEVGMVSLEILKKFDIFSNMPSDKLKHISQQARLLEFSAGEVLARKDDPALNLYGVVRGEVQLSLPVVCRLLTADIHTEKGEPDRVQTQGKQMMIDVVEPGEICGWSAMLDDGRQTTNLTGSKPGQILYISAAILKDMCRKDPLTGYELTNKLLQVVSDRLRTRTKNLVETWGESFEIEGE